ncbi:hypothetical protein [Bacillus sp. FJAT-25509]|nr:hypothetical protein [Bacillus sp. FJAT-25509]
MYCYQENLDIGNSDLELSAIGLGLIGMSPGIYSTINDEESIKTYLH